MFLVNKPANSINVYMMSDGNRTWLVIDNDGEWVYHSQINPEQKRQLKSIGLECNVDTGMSNPDGE